MKVLGTSIFSFFFAMFTEISSAIALNFDRSEVVTVFR